MMNTKNQKIGKWSTFAKLLVLFTFLIANIEVFAVAKTWNVTTGNWNTPGNWSPSGVPLVGDDVTIPSGRTVTVNVAAVCNSITFGNTSDAACTITISGSNSLTVTNAITFVNPFGGNNDQTVAVGAGTLTCATISYANTDAGTEDNFVTISTGTVNVGNIIFAGASNENSFTTSGAATLNITGAGVTGSTTGTFTVNTTGATVNYSGTSAQTIRAASYFNLNISGARTTNSITMGNTSVSNTFSNTATFTTGNYIVTGTFNYNGTGAQTVIPFNYNSLTISGVRTTNNVTISNSANINVAGTFSSTATFTSGACVVTGTTVNLNGAAQNISVASPFAFNNLTCAGSGTKTASTAININGTLDIGAGITLNMGAFALGGTLATLAGTGNLNTAEGSATPIPTGRTWPYTITYNSPNSQTVVHGNYLNLSVTTARFANNITLSNLGIIAISGTFTVSATFTTGAFINTGSTINFNGTGAQTITAFSYNNLTVSGARTTNNITISGVVNIAGTFTNSATFTSGAYVLTGSTINYNGTGAQTVLALNYNSLTISGARTTNSVTLSNSADINVAGTFTASATFTSGAYIVTGNTINLNGNLQNISVASPFIFNNLTTSGSGLKTATSNINVNGTLNITAGLNMGSFALAGTLATITGTSTSTLQTQNISSTPIPVGRTWPFIISYNTANEQTVVHGNYSSLFIAGTRTNNNVTLSNAGTINVSGTLTYNATFTGGILVTTGSTINLNGASQNIGGSSTLTLNNLTCSGSGTKTATGAISVNGTLTINSGITLNMATFVLGGTLSTLAGTGNLNTQAASTAPIPTGKTWPYPVDFGGTGAQTIVAGTYGNLTISGARAANSITLINGGTINVSGTLSYTATFAGGALVVTGNTINLNGAAQNIPAFTINNLTCSGSGIKTATGTLNVNGIFTINSGITVDMVANTLGGTIASTSGTGTLFTQGAMPTGETWTFTVNYNGAGAQTVVAGTYTNLTVSGSRTTNSVTLINGGTIAITGVFTNSASYTSGAYIITGNTINYSGTGAQDVIAFNYNNLTISGARGNNNIILANSGTIGIAGTFSVTATFTGGALAVTGSTIDLNGASQNIGGSATLNNLTCSGSGTKTATSAINVNGTLTINSGITLNMVTFVLGGTLNTIAGTGNLNTQAASTAPIPTGKTWTCAVNFGGTGAQTVVAGTYGNLTISGARAANSITLINGGTINVSGTLSYTATFAGGALVVTGNTINLNGAAQNIPTFTINNLTCSGSGIKTATGALNVNGIFTINSGITVDMVANTLGGTIASTSGTGTLLTQGAMPTGETWTFTVNYNGTGTQTVVAGTYTNLTISGSRTTNSVTLINGGTIAITGVFTNSASYTSGAYIITGNTINYNGTGAQDVIAFNYNNLTISGARGNNNIILANSGTIGIAGTFSVTATFTGGALVTNNSTVNLNGAAQNIGAFTFFNLSCTGSGSKTATGAINVTANLNIASGVVLNMATFALAGTIASNSGTGTLQTQNTSATPVPTGLTWNFDINYNGTGAQTVVAGTYTNLTVSAARTTNSITLVNGTINVTGTFSYTATFTTGTLVVTGNTLNLSGAAQNIGGSATLSLNNLTCNGSGTKTATGAINVAGTLTINPSVTLNMATFVLGGALSTVAGTGSLTTQAVSATPIPSGKTWTGAVDFGGTGAQTVVAGTYVNLTMSGARTTNSITLINGGTINVSGTLSNTATFTSGALVVTGNTVNLSGAAQNIGGSSTLTLNNLTCSGSGTKTATGAINVAGTLTINPSITLDMATFLLGGALSTVAGTGSLTTQAVSATPIPTGKTWTGTVTFGGTGAQTVVAGTYSNLTLSGARTTNSITLINGGTINLSGTLSNTASFTTGAIVVTGNTINFNGAAQNIPAFTFNNLTCSGSGSKTLTATVTVNGALTISANTLLLNDNQLNVNGTLAGTPVFVGSSNAILTFNGTGALGANVNFSQTSATTRTLKDLVVNRTSSTITLANPLEIIGALTLSNGTLASAGNLKLVSNLSSTARILPVTGTGAITGNVIVERFINASARRFRFLSSPINNGTLEDWRGEIFLTGNNAPTAHQSTTVGGALNWGFDATTGNQATVFTYNETVLGSLDLGYTEVKNSTSSLATAPLTIGRGYRVFIRGDRSTLGFLNGSNNTQNAVTMNLIGTPNVGDITMPVTFTNSGTAANDGWCLVGNPYACEYDWNALWDAGNSGGNSGTFYTNIDPTVYVFDPNSNSFKSYNASANSGTISNGIIPSGQAFFIKATAASPSLTFKEQFKVQGAPTFMFKASSADNDEFRLRLQFDNINSDDYIMKFIPTATKQQDVYDIIKLRNSNFNIASYISDSISFALDSRPEVKQNDTLFLNVTGVNGSQRIIVQNIPPNKYFYLVDNMLNVMIPLSNNLEYPFQIQTSNTKSFGKNRFYIVISDNATLPVKLNAFAVNLLNRNEAQLNWVTSLEINNSYFEIERSLDGENFEVVGRVKGNGSTSKTINYSYTDNISEIKANVIYYRLNQYDFDGSNELSPVRAVNLDGVEEDNAGEKTVQLSPNPVVSKTRLNFNTKITDEIEVKIFSEMGLLVEVIRVNPLTNPGFELDLSALETGMYILEAIDSKNNKFSTKFLKQ